MSLGDRIQPRAALFLMLCLLPPLTGCEALKEQSLTGRLWNNDLLIDHYEPSTNANLKLFQGPGRREVLVQYDEEREKDGAIRHRAYLLMANEAKVEKFKKPRFVKPGWVDSLEPIPLQAADAAQANPTPVVWAKPSSDGYSFTLVKDGWESRPYRLPVYRDKLSEMKRVLLTPPAAAVDGTVIAGGAAAALFCIWVESGCPRVW
jgi:hypothetical protein